MLNPFYLYSLIWSFVLIVYQLKWSKLNINLSMELTVYFIITIITSLILGYIFRSKYIFKENLKKKAPRILIPIVFILLGHLLQFFYVGKIPLVELILKTGYMYKDFKGIKTFHVILLTYNAFYDIYLMYLYISLKKNKYLYSFLLLLVPFVLLYNRGMCIFILFMSLMLYLSRIVLTFKVLIKVMLVSLISLYIFGILGNIRHLSKWNDTSYLNKIGGNKRSVKYIDPMFWSYIYISTPLSNLQINLDNKKDDFDLRETMIKSLLPDFIQKRIKNKKNKPLQVSPYLTTCTGFVEQAMSTGIYGMYLMYIIYSFIIIVYTFLLNKKNKYYTVGIAILCCITSFLFFSNMYTFSGLSFQLFYPIFFQILDLIKIKNNNIVIFNLKR